MLRASPLSPAEPHCPVQFFRQSQRNRLERDRAIARNAMGKPDCRLRAEVPYHFQTDEDSRTNSMFLERTNVPGASAVFRTKQAVPISRLGLFQRECNKLDACLQPRTREQAR